MSSPSSSFENLNFHDENLEKPKRRCLEKDLFERTIENALLRAEIQDIRRAPRTDEPQLRKNLTGTWKIYSSTGVEEYLQARRAHSKNDLEDVLFHVALQNLELAEHTMKSHESIGSMRFNEKSVELSTPVHCHGYSEMSYVSGEHLKTVRIVHSEEEEEKGEDVEEVSVKEDGRLSIVIKRYGVRCERVYRRDGEVEKEVEDLNSKILELKKENAKLTEEKKSVEKTMEELEEEHTQAYSDLLDQLDDTNIRKSIRGLWRNKNAHESTVAFKFDAKGNIHQQGEDCDWYDVYTLGEKHENNFILTIENNRIVQKQLDRNRETVCRYNWSVENGELIQTFGNRTRKVYERAGEAPEFE